ncbi:hypothetical protein [Lederbergia graminis]|uniref:Uncharacterized protein n=1 Tax=Lederbergia graminis TaxID=735518 RepID=A0ABW0LEF1_9BACI|nr:hypothetical protein [Paenibacillus bovis]
MDTIIIILLAASIILFIISFLQPDKVKSLEKEVEQLNMTILQEQYLVKKRLKVLEEELLMEQGVDIISRNSLEPNEILKNLVIALHKQGKNVHQISKQSSLPLETVKTIIHQTFGRV